MSKKLLFFGTLRSRKVLKEIVSQNLTKLKFYKCIVKFAKLKKVKNENYPVLCRTKNELDKIDAEIVENLNAEDIKRILFFESWEYIFDSIEVIYDNKKIDVEYLKPIMQTKISEDSWSYKKWKDENENYDIECAKLWMNLYSTCSDPNKAEHLWPKILNNAKKNIK